MEMVVFGIGVMTLGAALVHLAVEGRKPALAPVGATGKLPPPALLSTSQAAISRTATAHREEFSKTDVLLADALTELLNLKEQVNSLQARVDTLTSGQTRPATSPARRPVRRRISSDVK